MISGNGGRVRGALVPMPTSPAFVPVETGIVDGTRGGGAFIEKEGNSVVKAAASRRARVSSLSSRITS